MRHILFLVLLLSACQPSTAQPPIEIAARWDHRQESESWNTAMMQALLRDGARMLAITPVDADTFCPGYADADTEGRAAFWIALFSGLARYESTWNPRAAGAGGRYQGLLQISPATARHHDCDLSDPDGLYDGATNLRCATRIAAAAVTRDGVVASGRGGVAADWPPLRDPSKREDVAAFTRSLPVCQG
ncbi:MAG: putative soluble lytic transglycosylase [Rhodobacteraceae bacterium HLUCCA12]|nr:MAG: putative soluble lytic transglycosylase [Rhodobacteraceae bacterium HLUCCA12]